MKGANDSPAARAAAMKELQVHYSQVAISRSLEESTRASNPLLAIGGDHAASPLVIMVDAMDQSFWALPRLPRGPKAMSSLVRPRVKVTGAWAFHLQLNFFLAHEVEKHDASFTCEVLAKTIEQVRVKAAKLNLQMPKHLIVWADNTVRENKNNTVLMYLASLVASGQFALTALMNHQKGHTHSIIDQLFGIISRSFKAVETLKNLDDCKRALEEVLARPSLVPWFRGATINVEVVPGARDWKRHFEKLPIHIKGGMLVDATSSHCWMMIRRQDLPPRPIGGARGPLEPFDIATRVPHDQDVVCVVKRHVFHTQCTQRPQIILPVQDQLHLARLGPLSAISRRPWKAALHATSFAKLADVLGSFGDPTMRPTVVYLRQIANGTLHQHPLWSLPFHEACFATLGTRRIVQLPTPIFFMDMLPASRVRIIIR